MVSTIQMPLEGTDLARWARVQLVVLARRGLDEPEEIEVVPIPRTRKKCFWFKLRVRQL